MYIPYITAMLQFDKLIIKTDIIIAIFEYNNDVRAITSIIEKYQKIASYLSKIAQNGE